MVRKNGKLERVSWDEAMKVACDKFAEVIKRKGPNAVAYYGSGQATTEESYFMNRFMKGGIGTNNVEGNPRLCMASAVGGYVSTFGKDEPMGAYDDIEHAKVFFLVGSNTAECHPVIFDQIMKRKSEGGDIKVICVDPRRSPVSSIADLYLQPKPGYDLALFHAMAQVICELNFQDDAFAGKNVQFKVHTDDGVKGVDFAGYKEWLEQFTPEKAEAICGVPAGDIRKAAVWFAKGPSTSFWTMGLNQRIRGVWANNLMHNLHLITGQIGKPGMTPFSLTGQPNACGGVRDTGSLCHLLPYGHLVKKDEHCKKFEKFWGAKPGIIPRKPGKHTIAMFDAMGAGEIEAMFVTTTNPSHSLPNANKHRPSIKNQFTIVLDSYPTLTTQDADVLLPASMWSEKSGVFGMSERRYQLHPKVQDAPGECRADLQIMYDFAKGLQERGVVAAGYVDKFAAENEVRLYENVWEEILEASKDTPYDFRGMTRARLEKERGLRWPCPDVNHPGTTRRFVKGDDPTMDRVAAYKDDSIKPGELQFYAAKDKRAIVWGRPVLPPAEPTDAEYNFVLTTGRVIEHWHTGTMTMQAPELARSYPECYVEVNPLDATKLGVKSGDKLKITSRRGEARVMVKVVRAPREGMIFVPWHWADDPSLINKVTIDAIDPGSKQPEFKICAVKLAKA